jgi:hypothetical protein
MLRLLLLLLVCANAVYFTWSEGWLAVYGWAPLSQREPQRLAQQLQPEAIRIISEQEAARKPPPPVCLESADMELAQADQVRSAVQAVLPASAWEMQELPQTARWVVLMGPYPNAADLEKKRTELRKLSVSFRELTGTPLAPGLVLGSFEDQALADTALKKMVDRGVRSARVVHQTPPARYRLRLPTLEDSLQNGLADVKAALPGQTLQACAAPEPG